MRTCYFYTQTWDEAVAALPADAELVYVGRTFTSYWEAIAERWGAGDDLLIVEHDIVIHDQVVAELEACRNFWCVFPYWHSGWLEEALGCTRFRSDVQALVTPQEIQEECWASCWECNQHNRMPSLDDLKHIQRWREINQSEILGCWRHIDGKINWALRHRGYKPCVHVPPVKHLSHPQPGPSEMYVRRTG